MAARPVSREGSFTGDGQLSRRTSAISSNSDVFGDEHAYSDGDLTPVDSIQDPVDLILSSRDNHAPHITTNIPRSALLFSFNPADRPLSTSKRAVPAASTLLPRRAVPSVADSDAGTQRTFSTSSRFSIPRSQSPYNGPSAPTQPYAMYPQVTRASSVASGSTLRPPERPFVAQGGPEHPYGMYQNTVPEEEDDEHSPHIPVGFAAGGSSLREGSSSSGNDTGDIVGSDGHIEQLPPYSRYADNVIAKGDMGTIDPPATLLAESTSTQCNPWVSDSDMELNPATREQMEEEEQAARKEGWLAKSRRRKCCGLPLWVVILLFLIIAAAATLGGIIGGVIGNDKGSDRALASSAATTTVWLDAEPVSTGPGMPPCPTGRYTIPLNQTEKVGTCIVDPADLAMTWDCMNEAWLGISLFDNGPNQPYQIAFDDYSLRPQLFEYGPQPPDFNGTSFSLEPFTDKEDSELGVAMFFSQLFDKLIILEGNALNPDMGHPKRSVPASQIRRRGSSPQSRFLAIGDQPWYCFWNATIEEFYIFLEQDIYPVPPSASAAAMTTSPPASSATTPSSSTTATPAVSTNAAGYTPAAAATGSHTSSPGSSSSGSWPGSKAKPSSPYSDPNGSHPFPKLVKMVEKRKPNSNIQPYCQQMQVLNNWQVMPIPTVPTICIEETEFAQPTGSNKRRAPRQKRDSTQELESNCICEWFSHRDD